MLPPDRIRLVTARRRLDDVNRRGFGNFEEIRRPGVTHHALFDQGVPLKASQSRHFDQDALINHTGNARKTRHALYRKGLPV